MIRGSEDQASGRSFSLGHREVHATQEVREAAVGAEGIEQGGGLQQDEIGLALLVRLLEPRESLIALSQSRVNECEVDGRNIPAARHHREGVQHPQRLGSVAGTSMRIPETGQRIGRDSGQSRVSLELENRFRVHALGEVGGSQLPVGRREVWIHSYRPHVHLDRSVESPAQIVHPPDAGLDDRGEGVEIARPLDLRQGVIVTPERRQVDGIPVMRAGVARVELDGTLELPAGFRPVPVVGELEPRQRCVGFG